nr:MAG TPA: hypothetical protein [Caudoviricetes sp.]
MLRSRSRTRRINGRRPRQNVNNRHHGSRFVSAERFSYAQNSMVG